RESSTQRIAKKSTSPRWAPRSRPTSQSFHILNFQLQPREALVAHTRQDPASGMVPKIISTSRISRPGWTLIRYLMVARINGENGWVELEFKSILSIMFGKEVYMIIH
ncbi:unnamed protein product, partial [Fusarium graminearum]